jgi:hypothetical protein
MGSSLISSPSRHDRSDRDWNQRAGVVHDALQCSLDRDNHLAVDLSWPVAAFSALPFSAAMEIQGIYDAH